MSTNIYKVINTSGGGSGNVSGPLVSTNNAVPRFDGTDGETLQNSGVIIDDSDNVYIPGDLEVQGDIQADGSINFPAFNGNRALQSDGGKNIVESSVTATELGYVSGVTSAIQTQINSKISSTEKGANNGVATLDAGGKIPVAQLPNSVMEYKGNWDASTNTPTLIDGTGNAGDVYRISVAGTQDLGSGAITFAVGDWIVYNGSIWQKAINSNAVVSVNGQSGIVLLDTDDIPEGANLYYTDERAQDAVGTIVTNTAEITLTYSDGTPSITADLVNTTVSAGSYGTSSQVGSFTVDAKGRLTSASNTSISITSAAVTDFAEAAQDAVGGILIDTSSVNLDYIDGTPSITATVLPAGVDHNQLFNYVANQHVDHSSVQIATASGTSGLSGGGDITTTRNLVVDINGTTVETVPDNADKVLIYDNSTTSLKSMTRGNFLSGITTSVVGDINHTSFSFANNQVAAANVTGLAFSNATVRSFECELSVFADATSDLFAKFNLEGIQRGADWVMSVDYTGDDTGIDFTITTAGQVQYTSSNLAGFTAGTMNFRAFVTSV